MDATVEEHTDPRKGIADVLTIGFGTTVAMWAVGYVGRLPVVTASAPAILVLLLAALLVGGYLAGARCDRGVMGGLLAGGVTGLLNLLVLGSFLSARNRPNVVLPAAGLWIPGSIALSASLGAAGAALGARRARRPAADWIHAFARVAVAATFLLLIAGGLVTSNQAGLAVVDWPNSYGYNMFLYPFSRMTGGIYYEHAHRLLGALVGLTTMTLAVLLAVREPRAWVKRLGYSAAVLVVVQGILGGLRVTGRPTLGMDTAPNVDLAIVHGVTAQIFFSLLVAIAVVTSRAWTGAEPPIAAVGARSERRLASVALGALIGQIVFGAVQRHLAIGLMLHVAFAFVVAGLTTAAGVRAWGLYLQDRALRRTGLLVVFATALQFALGMAAWIVKGAWESGSASEGWKVVVTTLHQGNGAVLLAAVVALRFFLSRRLAPAG